MSSNELPAYPLGRRLDEGQIRSYLAEARKRTLDLVEPLSEEDLMRQHSRIMSPIVWDMGHIAHFEEVWLGERLDELASGDEVDAPSEGLRGIYNPFENPRSTRKDLPLPSGEEARRYMASVRSAVLDRIGTVDLEAPHPLLRESFVFGMVLQHEYQHNETILQTLRLKKGEPYPATERRLTGGAHEEPRDREMREDVPVPAPGSWLRFPGGDVELGTDCWGGVYDNERPRHPRRLDPFWIGATPVTEIEFLAFVEAGGYATEHLWSPEGWQWRLEEQAFAPSGWEENGTGWSTTIMDRTRPLDPLRPVSHICYWEAQAFARWADARLPTEFEWEAAAGWDADLGRCRPFPWGDDPPDASRANLDHVRFDTAPVGSHVENRSPLGCYGMIGDVWEWTSSSFRPYPGYETFPYAEYSEVFFGSSYKVLRGGSWATRPGAVRNTFRNWDFPIRRQIFSGLRLARDGDGSPGA